MSKVHKEIVRALRHYPDLFQTRMDVLHHMFIVNGSGYRWKRGELVYEFHSEDGAPILTQEEAERRATVNSLSREKPYPFSQYCAFATMPQDAKQEWKDAADEIRERLAGIGYQFKEPPLCPMCGCYDPYHTKTCPTHSTSPEPNGTTTKGEV